MKQFGLYMMIFGVGSIVLNLVGYEFTILMWIDNWGTGVGWGIRAALIGVGAAMFFLGKDAVTAEE